MASTTMKRDEFDTLIQALPRMTDEQRRHVSARLKFWDRDAQVRPTTEPAVETDIRSSWLRAGLEDEIYARGLMPRNEFRIYLKNKYPRAPSQIKAMEAFLLGRCPGEPLTPVEKRAFGRNVAWALVDWVEKRRASWLEISSGDDVKEAKRCRGLYSAGMLWAVCESIVRIPDAVNAAWPTYMANGWLRHVATTVRTAA